jgi:hypothetical protein
MDFEILEWDSQIFEIPTAVITNSIRDKEELERVVSEMRGTGIRLAYYSSPVQLGDFSEDYGGILVDRKITFHVGFGGSRPQPIEGKKLVVPFIQNIPTPEMESLAVQSGKWNRWQYKAVNTHVLRLTLNSQGINLKNCIQFGSIDL